MHRQRRMSGWFSTEATIARHAWPGLRASLSPPEKSAFTYAQNNKFALLALMLAISLVPDAFVIHLLVRSPWVALLLDAFAMYSLIWVAGIYGTMLRSPHTIDEGVVTIRRGLLMHASFPLDDVESAVQRDKTIDGVQSVEIHLRRPTRMHRFLVGAKETTTLVAASDLPEQLIAALLTRRNALASQ